MYEVVATPILVGVGGWGLGAGAAGTATAPRMICRRVMLLGRSAGGRNPLDQVGEFLALLGADREAIDAIESHREPQRLRDAVTQRPFTENLHPDDALACRLY